MNILILGGSNFVGYHIAEAALQGGHHVTLFNRGKSNPNALPQAEKLLGDRDGDLTPLACRRWDAAINTSGYVPRIVRKSAEALRDSVGHYHFISTVSVYAESQYGNAFLDEDTPTATLDDPTTEAVTAETYGALKVLCEQVVQEIYPSISSIARLGLVAGPRDYTERFPYWPNRVARGGEMIAPGTPDAQFQVIDARDMAAFVLTLVARGTTGIFNTTATAGLTTWGSMLDTCRAVTAGDA
jgi:2'-hydroxyisoflavone reductase